GGSLVVEGGGGEVGGRGEPVPPCTLIASNSSGVPLARGRSRYELRPRSRRSPPPATAAGSCSGSTPARHLSRTCSKEPLWAWQEAVYSALSQKGRAGGEGPTRALEQSPSP